MSRLGLLVCLIAFSVGLGSTLAATGLVRIYLLRNDIDTERMIGLNLESLLVVVSLLALSAMLGAGKHQRWLSDNLKSAGRAGLLAGILTGATVIAFGAAATWGSEPIAAAALVLARFGFLVLPAVIMHFVITSCRCQNRHGSG